MIIKQINYSINPEALLHIRMAAFKWNSVVTRGINFWLTLPRIFFQYCLHRMTAITASSSRMMPTRQPIRIAVLLLSSLATGSPALGVLALNSGSRRGTIYRRKYQVSVRLICLKPAVAFLWMRCALIHRRLFFSVCVLAWVNALCCWRALAPSAQSRTSWGHTPT